jgi:hypothetical protein
VEPHLNAYDNPIRNGARKMKINDDILTRTNNAGGTAKHFTNHATTTKCACRYPTINRFFGVDYKVWYLLAGERRVISPQHVRTDICILYIKYINVFADLNSDQ